MMNFPGVIAGRPSELSKLQTGLTAHVDGHAPGVRGHALNAYIAAGIGSEHERSTYEEALEKRRCGMWIMLREGSAARNLVDLLPLVVEHGPERCMFCTDDREPVFLVDEGHIDQMLRVAVAHGVRPEDALVMATLNPAQYHGLPHLGAVAPGYQADIVVLEDLRSFRPKMVLKRGVEPVHEPVEIPECVRRLAQIGGGVVVVEGGEVKAELALPVAGLMSDAPLAVVHEQLAGMERVLRRNGVTWEAPFMCLSFLALSVIPELKITDRGLVDVDRSELVPLKVD